MGTVESTPFVGNAIRKFSAEELEEMHMLRTLPESTVCGYAAEKTTPEAILNWKEFKEIWMM